MLNHRSAISFWLVVLILSLSVAPSPLNSLKTGQADVELDAAEQATIVLPDAWRTDAAAQLAASDLSTLLTTLYQTSVRISYDSEAVDPRPLAIIIGDTTNVWLDSLEKAHVYEPAHPDKEGYRIKSTAFHQFPVIVVEGGDVLGSVYGTFRLVEMLRIDKQSLFQPMDVAASPQMTIRAVSDPTAPQATFPSPEDALRAGFNTVFIEQWPSLISYAGYDPAITDKDKYGSYTSWVEDNRQKARAEIEKARSLHLRIATMGDVVSFPKQVLSLYKAQVTYDDDLTRFCIAKPKTQEMLSYSLDELLNTFPEIDFVMVRTGENYSSGPLTGSNPALGNKEACGNLSDIQRLQLVINTVYAQVVENHGKTYIHRAWDLGENGFHANPDVAKAIMSGVPRRDNLIVSFKHTKTDYWRFNCINPNIGTLDVDEMVEVQVAREYEGKGAFPNYVGELVASGGDETSPQGGIDYAYQHGVRAIWVWAKGGGWGGPQLRSTLWVDVNLYAVSHLAWNTKASPKDLALEWATLRFGARAASRVADVLMKSDDVVLHAFYIAPMGKKRQGWTPNQLWVRDDIIQGADQISEIYKATKDEKDFQTAVREKSLALELLDSMIAEYSGVPDVAEDHDLAERALNTLLYERSLVETLNNYLIGMLHYYRWQDSNKKDATERQAALGQLVNWQGNWQHYNTVIANLPGVATPYRDSGMVKTATAALQQLQDTKNP